MILPNKHTRFGESLLGLGGFILESLKTGQATVDFLWIRLQNANTEKRFPFKHGRDNLSLAIILLNTLDLVEEANGEIKLCN